NGLRARRVQEVGRGVGELEASKCPRVYVALPDHVYRGHADVNRLTIRDLGSDVGDHAVTQFAGVVEAKDRRLGVPSICRISENPFPREARLGVLSYRKWRIRLERPSVSKGRQRIDVPRRIDD